MEIKLSETQTFALKVLAGRSGTEPLKNGVLYPYNGVGTATMRVLVDQGYAETVRLETLANGIRITEAGRKYLAALEVDELRNTEPAGLPHLLYSQASDEDDPARAAELRRRAAWADANIERTSLREQAWRNYKSELESASKAYDAALADIDRVYKLRTGEGA